MYSSNVFSYTVYSTAANLTALSALRTALVTTGVTADVTFTATSKIHKHTLFSCKSIVKSRSVWLIGQFIQVSSMIIVKFGVKFV